MFESTKLLVALTRAVEWYKSHAHISFLSKVLCEPTQHERGIIMLSELSPFLREEGGMAWMWEWNYFQSVAGVLCVNVVWEVKDAAGVCVRKHSIDAI